MPCFYLVSRLLRYVVLQFPDQSYFTRYRMESMGEYTFIKAVNNRDGLKSTERLLCSAELPFQLNHHFTCLSVSSIVLSITSFMGNNLMLVAFHIESPLHAPPKNFIALFGCQRSWYRSCYGTSLFGIS